MEHIDGRIFGERNRCFGCGPNHPSGFHLRFRVDGDEVVTEFTPGETHEGVPTLMHGGLLSTIADEVGAWALIALRDRFGFTGSMKSRFPRPVRIGQPVEGRARITKENSRAAYVEVRLLQAGQECFTSTLTFILLDADSAEQMVGMSMPETMRRFFRARS